LCKFGIIRCIFKRFIKGEQRLITRSVSACNFKLINKIHGKSFFLNLFFHEPLKEIP